GGNGERDVRAARHSPRAVVLVPALVDGGLHLVAAGGQARREAVDPVPIGILQPRPQTTRVPITRAAQELLVAAGGGGDHGVDVVGDPVRFVAVVELDGAGRAQRQRDVRPVTGGMRPVVLVPAV